MLPITPFDPSQVSGGSIALNATDPGARILFYNQSNKNIKLDFRNGNQDLLYAWEARYWTLDGNDDEIDWTTDSVLPGALPISRVSGTLYGPEEELPGTYPVQLIRQVSIVAGIASAVQNDGNAAGTSLVEGTPSSDGVTATSITNIGTEVLGSTDRNGELDIVTTGGQKLAFTGAGIGIPGGNLYAFLDLRTNQSILSGFSNAAGNGVGLGGGGTVDVAIDSTGLALLLGNLTMPNASAIEAKDAGGTARVLLTTDVSNHAILRALAGASGQTIQLQDETGAAQLVVNDISPQVEIKNNEQVDGNLTVGKQPILTPRRVSTLGVGSTIVISNGIISIPQNAAVTGVKMTAGATDGQLIIICNTGAAANTITFATAATSLVADSTGSNEVIAGLHAAMFMWDATAGLWYRILNN